MSDNLPQPYNTATGLRGLNINTSKRSYVSIMVNTTDNYEGKVKETKDEACIDS